MFGRIISSAMSGALSEEVTWRLSGQFLRETSAAILFRFAGQDIWFPKSHARLAGTDADADLLVITDWIARQKGLR